MMLAPLSSVISAFLWRFKGMKHPWATQTNRICAWVLPVSILMAYYAYCHNYPLWLAGISGLLIWGSIAIGHGKWQNDAVRSFWGMVWITWVRLTAMLLPFIVYALLENQPFLWDLNDNRTIALIAPVYALLAWPACWLGYKFDDYGLKLSTLGFVWCDPVKGSEWEELFIGLLPYGTVFTLMS